MKEDKSIKTLFIKIVLAGAFFTLIYMYFNFVKVQNLTRERLNLESMNNALIVSKKLSRLNDAIAIEYEKYDDDMYIALKKTQSYIKENGRDTSLEPLQKELNAQENGVVFNIYLINRDYIIDKTTFEPDLNLDFHVIPNSIKLLENVYENPDTIDLSAPMYERITSEYVRYIVQKSYDGEYLVQVSMKISYARRISKYARFLKESLPKLLKSTIVFIYPKDDTAYLIDLLDYENFKSNTTKQESFGKNNLYKELYPLFNPAGKLTETESKEEIDKFLKDADYKDYYFHKDGKYIHRVLLPFFSYLNAAEDSVFAISIEFDEIEAENEIEKVAFMSIMIYIIMFALVGMALFVVNRRIIEPLSKLQVLMKEKKEIDISALYSSKDEIGSVSLVYNQLLRDIKREVQTNEELLAEFKNFTANSIHQVRTPVSVIKIALEMIESPNKEALNQIKASLVSIEHLYDTLSFTLSQDKIEFKTEELNLSEVLTKRVALFQVVAEANDKKIILDIKPDVKLKMSLVELEFLIDNNISNAIKYSIPMTEIYVKLVTSKDEISLVFESRGKIIEDTKIIFERYFRADKSRKGHGIGLHIVDTICRKNNILIHVDSFNNINKFVYYFERM